MLNHNEDVPRPVRPTDGLVIFMEFVLNLCQVVTGLIESIYEISVYHSNRETKLNRVWNEFTQDLESIQEDIDGA